MGVFKDARNAARTTQLIAAQCRYGTGAASALKSSYDAKDAKASVIKHAVVGGIVAGPAGAVVGATAAKAKQDAKRRY